MIDLLGIVSNEIIRVAADADGVTFYTRGSAVRCDFDNPSFGPLLDGCLSGSKAAILDLKRVRDNKEEVTEKE